MEENYLLPRLIQLLESFGGQKILLIGDLILDRYVFGDAERISPEAPVAVLRKSREEHRVGGAGNVAADLRELGMNVICCGAIGDDEAGQQVKTLLNEQAVNTNRILTLPDRPTTTKTRFVGLAQHRHRQQLIRVDEERIQPLSSAEQDKLTEWLFQALPEVDAVCLEDYDKGLLHPSLCQRVIQEAQKQNVEVLVDPARINDYEKYRGATILTPNRSEFKQLSGCNEDSVDSIREAVSEIVERYELGGLLITLDREGSLLALRDRKPQLFPTRPRSVYDNTGAGDAVLAALAAARVVGADWQETAILTNVAGGLEVEKFGCVPISRAEIIADLRLALGDSNGKVRNQNELAGELKLRQSRGESIVFTNGCFDLLHVGHVRFLEQCREHGAALVVGLNSDASVQTQNKGTDRPIIPQDQRAEVLAALQCVDYVVIYDEPTPKNIVEKLSPNILVKGEDWAEKGVVGREHVESTGGQVILLPLLDGVSTTKIVERIRSGESS